MKCGVAVAACLKSCAVRLLVEICQWCQKILHFSLREGGHTISPVAVHRERCSLSPVDSCWELYTTQPAWQSPLSRLKPAASQDSGLPQASPCGFAEGGGGVPTASRSSALSEMWPLATERIGPSSALLPRVS